MLELLAAAAEPVSLDFASELLGWNEYRRREVVQSFGLLLDSSTGVLRPFHTSLLDWLTGEQQDVRFFVSVRAGHERLADALWAEYERGPATMSPYAIAHLPKHLIGAGRWEHLAKVLTDLDFVDAKSLAGLVYDLIADYNRAIWAWPGQEEIRREEEERLRWLTDYSARLIAHSREPDRVPLPAPPPSVPIKPAASASERRGYWTPLERVQAWGHFVANHTKWLGRDIPPAYQLAYNSADSGPVAEAVKLKDLPSGPWLRLKNRPSYNPHPACLKVLEGHTGLVDAVSLTPDGRRAISGSSDGTLRMWDVGTGECLAIADCGSLVVATDVGLLWLVAGTGAGSVQFIAFENLPSGPPTVTAARLWLFGKAGSAGVWDANLTASCSWCGGRFAVEDEWLGREIACPLTGCAKPLKMNPFVCDNSGRLE